jgi:hypothetical protein
LTRDTGYATGKLDRAAPFEDSLEDFNHALALNTVTPWAAARESVKAFEKLAPADLAGSGASFIFTGNLLNVSAIEGFLTFGIGKTGGSHMIQHLASSAYEDKPYK